MTSTEKKIAFKIEFQRILELFAGQIYQSPLALLRENTQNAFDAIRQREAYEKEVRGHDFEPEIRVTVDEQQIVVVDNGIGMTAEELETNFWYAGRSSKNTDAARAAGVVGTFGIGAMSNFGVADELFVESESAVTGERTESSVRKSELSTDTEGISVKAVEKIGKPGTTVKAHIDPKNGVPVQDARNYLKEVVEFVDIPVTLNGEKLSGASHRAALPSELHAWTEKHPNISLAGVLSGDLELVGMASGELRVLLENVQSATGVGRTGSIVLLQGRGAIRTLRSGFGLANVGMRSIYNWGGVVDLPFLSPTAGREALDAPSNQLLQQVVSALDNLVSPIAAGHAESFNNDGFLRWISGTQKFALCGQLEVTLRPAGTSEALASVVERSAVQYYSGREDSVIGTYASEETPLIVLSQRAPRRDCELGYLLLRGINEVDLTPRVDAEIPITDVSFAQSAFATRVARILEEDYFLRTDIRFGSITGGLPLLVTDTNIPVVIYFDPNSSSIATLITLYLEDYNTFAPYVKDFIRATVFPRVSKLVPSSTREGAEAFLRHLRSNLEWFEYEFEDKASLDEVLEELRAGRMTIAEAARRMSGTDHSFVEVSSTGTALLESVVSGLEDEADASAIPDAFDAIPGIDRRESETGARILTSNDPVNGYTCFLSLSDRVHRERGDFFLQPHTTEVVWGGRKVVFIFQHHSGRFGLYYDILCPALVGTASGGGPRITSTILTKNRTFIPVPDDIAKDFLPNAGEKKRLEVRCDILYLGELDSPAS